MYNNEYEKFIFIEISEDIMKDNLVNKLAQQHQANQPTPVDPNAQKRWSVKY